MKSVVFSLGIAIISLASFPSQAHTSTANQTYPYTCSEFSSWHYEQISPKFVSKMPEGEVIRIFVRQGPYVETSNMIDYVEANGHYVMCCINNAGGWGHCTTN